MVRLPQLPYSGRQSTSAQTAFAGLNANINATDGEIVAMENLTGTQYPVLSTRQERKTLQAELESPHTLWADDDLVMVCGTTLTVNGTQTYTVSDSPKQLARMLRKLIIFPDKKIIDLDSGVMTDMEAAVAVSAPTFQNGTIFDENAEANTLYKAGADWAQHFRPGDAVTISGATIHPENNKTPIIREIDGDYLRFYEYVFTLDPMWSYAPQTNGLSAGTYHFTAGGSSVQFTTWVTIPYGTILRWDGTTLKKESGDTSETVAHSTGSAGTEITMQETATRPYTETGTITVKREVPDMEFLCVNENRLWGCAGDTIYASKLGDPLNFNVFDGLSTDSWQSQVGDKGDFTACISYLGYPMFFKEESVLKVYGDKPSNFQWTPSARFGVAEGSHLSLAVANETLFYLSPAGIAAYTGGIPSLISEPLGVSERWKDAVAGSDGVRYFVSMQDQNGAWSLYVYDTRHGTWHREDSTQAVGIASWNGSLMVLTEDGKLFSANAPDGEEIFPWSVEFADSAEASPQKKGMIRLLLRMELEAGSICKLRVRYDDGKWMLVREIRARSDAGKQSYVVPIILRRCDHWRLRMEGIGQTQVYSIAQTRYVGSEKHNR